MKKVLILCFAGLVLASCASNEVAESKDVNQDKIYQNYKISYDETNNQTDIIATFRFGGKNGTTLILTPPSTITFNGESMTRYQTDFVGTYYRTALSKPLANNSECKFEFKDTKGKSYMNSLKFNAVLIGGLPAIAKHTDPLNFTLITHPLAYGEQIVFKLKDTTHTVEYVVNAQVPEKKQVIPASVIQELRGEVTITATRSYRIELQKSTKEGGVISFEYKTKPQTVVIE